LSDLRHALIKIVELKGLLRMAEPVQLASGEWSCEFIDGKRALASGQDLRLACEAIVQAVDEAGIQFDAVGGLTLGADQFAHGTAIVAAKDWFVVRKVAKDRGTRRRIEGADLEAVPRRVLLVDDIVTTGGSILEAFDVIEDAGSRVVCAVTLVDRGDTARPQFEARGVPYLPLVTYADLGIPPVGVSRSPATV
jgi:orotate phosphoribosyltransferase